MNKYEKIGFFAALVGLIVNALQISGFVFGFFEIPPALSFLGNPFVLAVSTYFFSLLCICGLLYFLIQVAKVRWKRRKKFPRRDGSIDGLDQLSMLLWIPIEILWAIGMTKYFWRYFFGTVSFAERAKEPDLGIMLFMSFALFTGIFALFPDFQLPSMAKSIDDFFDPKD